MLTIQALPILKDRESNQIYATGALTPPERQVQRSIGLRYPIQLHRWEVCTHANSGWSEHSCIHQQSVPPYKQIQGCY